ncbi:MAG: hypothetical protein ACFFC7_14730 [Candidatus Hermodarchaeota archaeon]
MFSSIAESEPQSFACPVENRDPPLNNYKNAWYFVSPGPGLHSGSCGSHNSDSHENQQ